MSITVKQQKCIQLIEKVLDITFKGSTRQDATLWIGEYLPKSKTHVEHMRQVVFPNSYPTTLQEYTPHTPSTLDVLERNSVSNGCPSIEDIDRSIDFGISRFML